MAASTALCLAFACGRSIDLSATPEIDAGNDAAFGEDAGDAGTTPPPPDGSPDASSFVIGDQPNVTAIALDSDNVYWATNVPNGGIFRCPKTGNCPTPLLVGGRDRPGAIATFAHKVYWTEKSSRGIHWTLVDSPSASEPEMAADRTPGGPIALDDAGVYMLDGDDAGQNVSRCLFSDLTCKSHANNTGAPPTAITASGGAAFFTSFGAGELRRVYPGLAIEDMIVDRTAGATHVAATPDDPWIYFVNEKTSRIHRANRTKPNNQTTETVAEGNNPQLIAVDGTNVYWTSTSDQWLRSCVGGPLCEVKKLLDGHHIGALAADASGVWFSSLDDQTVRHFVP